MFKEQKDCYPNGARGFPKTERKGYLWSER